MEPARYEIISLIGKGRTGGVYLTEDTMLSREVAMRRFFCAQGDTDTSVWENEFHSITQGLCNLHHPNILTTFDAGIDDDGAYIISQMLKNGVTLSDYIKENSLTAFEGHKMAFQLLEGLIAAHHSGFIHGAFNPGSVMLIPQASGGHRAVIMDLGLSRLAPLIQGSQSKLGLMADPALLAPELFNGQIADERSDLYMIGQLLYLAIAGGHPFGGLSIDDAAAHHLQGVPPISEFCPELPDDFTAWLQTLVQPAPCDRPQTVQAALDGLPKVARTTPAPQPIEQTQAHVPEATQPSSSPPKKNTSSHHRSKCRGCGGLSRNHSLFIP